MKNNKINMRVSDSFMDVVTLISETLGINKTKAVVFLGVVGYTTFNNVNDIVSKYDELREVI